MTTTAAPHSSAAPAPTESRRDPKWLARTLGRLLDHVRTLVHIDGAAFLRVDPQQRWIEPLADWFASSDLRAAIGPSPGRRFDRERPGLPELVLERDRPLLLPRVEAWEAATDLRRGALEALGAERSARVWEAYRRASVIACPVKTAVGRPLGVLVVASLDPDRPLGRSELRTVEVLADLAAMALERAELLEAEARRAREELRLKRASEAMSASLEPHEVYKQVVGHAVSMTGATKALLTRLNSRARELRVAARVDISDDLAERRLPLSAGMLGQVARTRTPYVSRIADQAQWDRTMADSAGISSFMHVPIELGPRLFGVLTVGHEEPDRFDEGDLELLVKLARSSAAAIANAIDFQRERHIARALTLGFVPESLPEVEGFEVGLLYAPAANEPTGGDLYGAWRLPNGEVAVLIGDVAGKGVETAALSAMVRFFIEARSWDSICPATVLEQANATLMSRLPPDTFVTAFLGLLSEERLRYSNAGHLSPLVVSRSGESSELGGHGLPLGVQSDPAYGWSELALAPGDLVFAYTDGMVEARRAGHIYGPERLRHLVASRGQVLEPEELVRVVHEEVAAWAGGLSDDAVALAIRRPA
jgi:GAF domain-containing protein